MRAVHESDTAERLMPGRLVAGVWTLNPRTGVRITTGSQFFDNSKFPLRLMEGRRTLTAEIVVQVHGREPELWSIGRMADYLSAGTGSTPVSPP